METAKKVTSIAHITIHVQMLRVHVLETMKKILKMGKDVGMSCIKGGRTR